MFDWLRKKRVSERVPPAGDGAANVPNVVRGSIAFSNADRSWDETFDCVHGLRDAIVAFGRSATVEGDDVVVDAATGLRCRPTLASFQPIHPVGARTTTTIEVEHAAFEGVRPREFQHSTGDSTAASIAAGFEQWCRSDLVTLADAMTATPGECMTLRFETRATDAAPARRRRVILGPPIHVRTEPDVASATGDGHTFCPCCLFTKSIDALKPLLDADGLMGLRLFAMRGADGEADADCRVNGEEFPAGKTSLRAYAATWPPGGVEFRKQYVIVQDAPGDAR